MRWLAAATAVAIGCGGRDAGGDGDGDFVPDPPAACAVEPGGGGPWPAGPYGTEVGQVLAPVELSDCDGSPVDLGEILGQSQLMLLNVGAGWCEPCIEESETIDADIFLPFCPRGLRVVQIVFQDEESDRATQLFCGQWRARFRLNFPVLYDPLFESSQYFDDFIAQTPVNFLIAPDGEILYRETGTPAADLPQRIDALLPP